MCMLSSKLKKGFGLSMLILVFIMVFSVSTFAEDSDTDSGAGYTINKYKVDINVGLNNVLDVTENINANFDTPKHGIYRYIPVISSATRNIDGKQIVKTQRIIISDISVKDSETGNDINYEKNRQNDNLVLKIGDKETTFTGSKNYTIHYKYDIGADNIKQFDDLYYNIIGTGWDTQISNVTFSIKMPKTFDKSLLGFTSGYEGSSDTSKVQYSVDDETITGSVKDTLSPHEGVTVRLQLPNGYFIGARENSSIYYIPLFIVMAVMVLISFLLFYRFGRDDKVYETVEFYPPEGMTSADAGYVIDGNANNRDVVSLIIYWADKGYLDIKDNGNKEFTLIKRKDEDNSMKTYEKYMFKKLFKDSNTVSADDLKYVFYETVSNTKSMITESYKKNPEKRIFTTNGNFAQALCYVCAGICTALMIYKSISDFFFSNGAALAISAFAFVFIIAMAALFGHGVDMSNSDGKGTIIGFALPLILSLIVIAAWNVFSTEMIVLPIFSVVTSGLCAIIGGFAKKRTRQGSEWLSKLLGLKKFINLAEKDRINTLVSENPAYFYNILPFAYVLGVTDKWSKKFEGIAIEPPSWYSSNSSFDPIMFGIILNSNMNSFQNNMVSRPNSDSGGGDGGFGGGGGFSGGGFGGGGGGSW